MRGNQKEPIAGIRTVPIDSCYLKARDVCCAFPARHHFSTLLFPAC